eukprot:GEMP01001988.1.p1 GENE.GEMP01001988.1~~GEMP01001988.1.p1  ORF type:complete len:1340 (+),score=382.14 GEMP01001988.1:70-4089(+)
MPSAAVELNFSGFDGELADLNGSYGKAEQENHGRQVYRKLETGQDVMVYFWDDRDGPQLQGWWVAPEVGGANVWAMNPDDKGNSYEPPETGWKVPWHGEVDHKVVCARPQPGAQKRPADGQWNSNQSKVQRWGNNASQWGTPSETHQPPHSYGGGHAAPQGQGQGQQWGKTYQQWGHHQPQMTTHSQQQQAQERLVEAERAAKSAAEEARRAEMEAKQLRLEDEKRKREADSRRKTEERLRVGVQQASISVTNAEKKFIAAKDNEHAKILFQSAIKDISAVDMRRHSEEEGKLIRMALSSITGTKNSVEAKITELDAQPKSAFITSLQGQLTGFLSRCDRALENTKALEGQKSERELLLWSQLGENLLSASEKEVTDVEKAVETVKDAAALLTSDLAEHLSPEETLKATDETDNAVKHATTCLQTAHRNLQAKQKELASCPQKMQDRVAELMRKCTPWHQELNQLRKTSNDASRKAKTEVEQKKRKEEEMKKQRKIQRSADWNKQLVEDLSVECLNAQLAIQMGFPNEAETIVLALEQTYKDYVVKPALGKTISAIQSHEASVKELQAELENKKKVTFAGDVEMRMTAALVEYMTSNKRASGDVFRMLSRGSGFVSQKAFETFAPVSLKNVTTEMAAEAFKRVDVPRATPRGKLSQEEFQSLSEFYLQVESPVHMTESEDDDATSILELPEGRFVQLVACGTPMGESAIVRAKVKDCESETVGWVTIFDTMPICKTCLFYRVVKETVLTEGADMKGLKVVRRVRKDEILRLMAPPPSGTGMGRIKTQCMLDNKLGYITMCSSEQKYLEPEHLTSDDDSSGVNNKGVRVTFGEAVDVQSKDMQWYPASLVAAEGDKITIAWEDESEAVVPLSKIRTRGENPLPIVLPPPVPELEQKIIDRSEQLISKVEVPEVNFKNESVEDIAAKEDQIAETCATMQVYLTDVQKFLLQREIQMRVHGEVLSMILSRVNNVQRTLNSRRLNLRMQIEQAVHDARLAEEERLLELEARKEAERVAERERSLEKARELVDEVSALFTDIRTKSDTDLSEEANPAKFLSDLQEQHELALKKQQTILEYLAEELAKMSHSDFTTGDMKLQFMKHQSRLRKLSENSADLGELKEQFFRKERDALVEEVAAYLESKGMTEVELFEQLEVDDVVTKDRFLALFQTNLPFDEALDIESFRMLVGNYWYALREVTLTSELCVTKSRMVRNVSAFDIFRAIGAPELDESTRTYRIRVMYENNDVGWISQQQGSIFYCKPLPKTYTIKIGTVVTDKPELTQLKVIKRLKVGDVVKPISLPKISKLLLRVKGRCHDGTEGWFTLVDNMKKTSFVNEFDLSN